MDALKSNYQIKILCVVAFLLMLILGRNFTYGSNHILTNSKENASLTFIEQFQEDLDFAVPLPNFNDPVLQNALTPRDAAQLNDQVVPQSFPGILFVFAVFSWLPFLIPLLTALTFAFIIFFYHRTVKRFFSAEIAFYSSLLLVFLPTFFYLGTNLISDDLLSLLFLLAGIDVFLDKKKMPLAAFLLGFSIFIRLPNVVWVLPILIFGLIKINDKSYFQSLKIFFISILTFLIPIISIFLANHFVYGDFLKSGYQIQYPILSQFIGTETGLFSGDINDFWLQIKQYLLFLYPLPLLLAAISIHKFYAKNQKNLLRIFYVFLGIFLFLTFQYAGSIFWGHDHAALNSSFMRYVLPFYLLLPVLSIYGLSDWKRKSKIIMASILLVSFLITSFHFRGGILEKWSQEEFGLELQDKVLAETNGDTLIISRFYDKFIFPLRQTITLPLLRSDIAYGYTDISPWQTPLDYEQIAESMSVLHSKNHNFILLSDSEIDISRLQNHLSSKNLRLGKAFNVNKTVAYKAISL